MNPSPMRRLFSSKLFLYSIIAFLLCFAANQILVYFSLQSVQTIYDLNTLISGSNQQDTNEIISLALLISNILVLLLSIGISLPMVLGCFKVYSNARNGLTWKTSGFTLIKAYCIIYVVSAAFSFTASLFSSGKDYNDIATTIEQGLNLVMGIMALQTAKAAQEYARYGFTPKRVSGAFSVVILVSLCVLIGELILLILTRLFGSQLTGVTYDVLTSPGIFWSSIAVYLAQILSLSLYYVLVKRLKTAICSREPSQEPDILLN